MEEGTRALATIIEHSSPAKNARQQVSDINVATQAIGEVVSHWLADPAKVAAAQASLMRTYSDLWSNQLKRLMGGEARSVVQPEAGDNRFRDTEWSENPYFDFWKQSYLATTRWAEEVVAEADGIDDRTRQRANFYLRQAASALSPSNFPFTNPEVVRETIRSNGENLARGMEHLLRDLERSGDMLRISQTDTEAFRVGENLATTKGSVVYQNDVMQLIQYAPRTATVHDVPILVVPPWINKFYILDLTPDKSFIKHALDAGFTVFVVSWVNPGPEHADKGFPEYMYEGVLAAADVAAEITGSPQSHVLGYCVGGTLLGTTLAWLAARGEEPFRTATFLTTQLDFENAGDLLVFVDDVQIDAVEEMMEEKGYLEGSRMAQAFNMLRPRDLIWPYFVNNYLLGKKPFPFDLLFWNQDSTRMPKRNHAFYLREFYQGNRLTSGEMLFEGERLDLAKVKLPVYELATREDHIAPARSVFTGARHLGGDVRFVLAGSGHIAGVVNPPAKLKYQYWTGAPVSAAATLDDWLALGTKETPGSWWPDWYAWLAAHSGAEVPAREVGSPDYPPIEDAPGSYVLQKA
ncbi:MAG: class I poly(R)-hydroxyalkanoic acid synthase [Rhizobiales bacterium]|nr:class I poly(R)-hydroxyalkanoic acid synthase [Hyphomicrobiales bacterium]